MTRLVSDAFRAPQGTLPSIEHFAAVEMEAPILAAEIIAFLMQPDTDGNHFAKFIDLLCNYFQGKGGDTPSQLSIAEAKNIRSSFEKFIEFSSSGKQISPRSIFIAIQSVYKNTKSLIL